MLFAMHIPDGLLGPAATVATVVLAAAAVAYSCWRLRGAVGQRLVPLTGMMSAGIFAAQMVNLPLPLLHTSGHLMGGVLAAVVLGPWGAAIALTAVLIVQCLMFGDGGLLALGANVLNMAVIGGIGGYGIYIALRRAIGGRKGVLVGAVAASWLIIPIAAIAAAAELAPGVGVPFAKIGTLLLLYHLVVGVIEAVGTGLVVSWILRVRPDLIYGDEPLHEPRARLGGVLAGGLAVSLAIAAFLSPWASEHLDAFEKVTVDHLALHQDANAQWDVPVIPFPDYGLREDEAAERVPLWRNTSLVTALLGSLGTLVTFGVALGVAGMSRLGRPARSEPHAA